MYKNGVGKHFLRASRVAGILAIFSIGPRFSVCQQPTKNLSFEVATVKPVMKGNFNPSHFWAHVSPAGASYWSMTIGELIVYAYDVDSTQVTGPEWATADPFDIEARFPEGADKKDDRRMLQALLKDRFNLAFHVEKREQVVYALLVGNHGEKMTPSLPDPSESETKTPMGNKPLQTVTFDQEKFVQHWEIRKTTMEQLTKRLSICVEGGIHKVIDETGLKGTYQIAFDCPMPRPLQSSDPGDGYALTKSLQAVGLKVEKRKVLMDVYVIDHVERPSAN